MGQPKQLMTFEGKSLVRLAADAALVDKRHVVMVVLGAHADAVARELAGTGVRLVTNSGWQSGMASSIRVGVESLLDAAPDITSCILAVCDQPFLSATVLEGLKSAQLTSGKGIAASAYDNTYGTPALFTRPYFKYLLQLEGQEGAKKVIRQYSADTVMYPFEKGRTDIDTMEEYNQLTHQMISVEAAKEIISRSLPEWNRSVQLHLAEAAGHVAAADVVAGGDFPRFAQSSMDGYAIRFQDKDRELEIAGEIPAGASELFRLKAGKALRIFTGAPMPAGADTVVMQEKVTVTAEGMLLVRDEELSAGLNVRPRGSEVSEGAVAMTAGTFLSAAAIGFLAGIGKTQVEVVATPAIVIIVTGNELQEPGLPLGYGQVYESNSIQLRSALKHIGINDITVRHVKDDPAMLTQALADALGSFDMVLLVGGVSVGDYDFVANAAVKAGVRQGFHRVRQKPGKPLFFGTLEDKLVFGLPGNPSSALTCFYMYVAPALEAMLGRPHGSRKLFARTTHAYRKKAGLTHFLKAFFDGTAVTPLHAQESYRLHSFAQANCFLVLGEASTGCEAGDEVEIQLLNL